MTLQSINPATDEPVRFYEEFSSDQVNAGIETCHEAFRSWRTTPFSERARRLTAAAKALRADKEDYARLMTCEMGKPISQSRSEIEKCAWGCEYYSQNAERFLASETIATDATRSFVAFQPLGVILAVMPWNFPFWQVFRCAAPALMAGNGVVLKHASNVCGCALAIEAVFRDAGLSDGLFRTLLIGSSRIPAVIDHPRIKAVTLTGSTSAGAAVAEKAGAALKKTVLELGGSDPYIVLEDADVPKAAAACATSRLINGGQSCIAAKRFIVVESVRQEFEEHFVERMREQQPGNPLAEATKIGPLARRDLRTALHEQVERSIKQGAVLLLGGNIPDGAGAFYPSTVLTHVKKGMAAYDEETFGPVAAVIAVSNEDEAIAAANDSNFGLGAAVFTGDAARGERIAKQLEAGSCFVNDFVRSDPRLPFGGVKHSGYGRELGIFGIREFVNIKTIYVR